MKIVKDALGRSEIVGSGELSESGLSFHSPVSFGKSKAEKRRLTAENQIKKHYPGSKITRADAYEVISPSGEKLNFVDFSRAGLYQIATIRVLNW